ncbi:hypothetical protein C0995_005365 [Termitomyces sp. Mi166|nr:hypothetical protein C0995_005365 [Termitomyces sp. Mi166\
MSSDLVDKGRKHRETPPPSLSLDEIKQFFEAKPPQLLADLHAHTLSTHTRDPGSFDKHLHPSLRLRRVVRLPGILGDLISNVDDALKCYPGDLPPVTPLDEFPTRARREAALSNIGGTSIRNESGVENVYQYTIGSFCTVVAETLAFQLKDWKGGCLQWTPDRLSRKPIPGVKLNQAVADGFLNLAESQEKAGIRHHMTDIQRDIFNVFPEIAIWEFKNMNFDLETKNILRRKKVQEDVFKEIVHGFLTGAFPWISCEEGENCPVKHPKIGINACRMGNDAKFSPCPSYVEARENISKQNLGPEIPIRTKSSARNILQQATKVISPWRQAWTEAVIPDVTFIVIQAGNIEVICMRDRANQTLFVSDSFRLSDDTYSYYKLHTGLYIAAIRDAKDRADRINNQEIPWTWYLKSGVDSSDAVDYTGYSDKLFVVNELLQHATTRPWLSIQSEVQPPFRQPFTTEKYLRRDFKGTPDAYRQWAFATYNIGPSESDVAFELEESHLHDEHNRLLPTLESDPIFDQPIEFKDLFQVIAQESFHGQNICVAKVEIPGASFHTNRFTDADKPRIILKNASRPKDIFRLSLEYKVTDALRKEGFTNVPEPYGFFLSLDPAHPDASFAALLLEDKGISLAEIRSKMSPRRFIVTPQQQSFFKLVLSRIHEQGILHVNLTARSLLFNCDDRDSNDIAIVGFERARAPHVIARNLRDDGKLTIDEELNLKKQILVEQQILNMLLDPATSMKEAEVRSLAARDLVKVTNRMMRVTPSGKKVVRRKRGHGSRR